MNINPRSVLDIGANVGEWTAHVRQLWPQAHYFLIEANPGCREKLQLSGESFAIALLGAERKESVDFYTLDNTATGASVYRELTGLYDHTQPIQLEQTTLDYVFSDKCGFDFIKIDTQGSELDILRGGLRLLSKAKWVLLEVSTSPYNEGAPLLPEVCQFMVEQGFPYSSIEACNQPINQLDLLFFREL